MKISPLEIAAKTELIRRGLSIAGLARDLGISREHLSQVLHGHRVASRGLRRKVAARLGSKVGSLLTTVTVTPVASRGAAGRVRR